MSLLTAEEGERTDMYCHFAGPCAVGLMLVIPVDMLRGNFLQLNNGKG
jgi:hypothetical protein